MSEYYDKEKFTGGRASGPQGSPPPPPRPPQRREDNSAWYSWPLIIILFALGAWPIALVLLFFNIFGKDKQKNWSSATYRQAESAVERAMRKAEERMNSAAKQADSAIHQAERQMDAAADKTDAALRRAAEEVERTIRHAAREVEQAGKSAKTAKAAGQTEWAAGTSAAAPKESGKKAAKAAKPAKQKKARRKPAGVLLRILGIIFLAMGSIMGLESVAELLQGYWMDFEMLLTGVGFFGAGALMFGRGHYLNKMSRRSQRYIMAIGNVDAMPLSEIAKRVNRTPAKAAKELQKLIDKGYLGEDAYIDHERGYFLRFGATLEEEDPFEPEIQVEEPAAPPPSQEEVEKGYSGILRNIRRANDRIADPELSRKIERIEQVTGLIFREVEEHPEKRERIRTFFDYYLPTTQKLLDAYAEFEETGVEGENLRQAKDRIEQTMDLIVEGFERQLDQLYSSDAMDVVTDIKVMEAMLNRDSGSVAKDFGFPESDKKDKKDGGDFQQLQL